MKFGVIRRSPLRCRVLQLLVWPQVIGGRQAAHADHANGAVSNRSALSIAHAESDNSRKIQHESPFSTRPTAAHEIDAASAAFGGRATFIAEISPCSCNDELGSRKR